MKIAILRDNNSPLAVVSVPNSAALLWKEATGVATDEEAADILVNRLKGFVRNEVRQAVLSARFEADYATVRANQDAEAAAFDADYPEA